MTLGVGHGSTSDRRTTPETAEKAECDIIMHQYETTLVYKTLMLQELGKTGMWTSGSTQKQKTRDATVKTLVTSPYTEPIIQWVKKVAFFSAASNI